MTAPAAVWIAVGLTVGAWLNWKVVAPRLRTYTEVSGDSITVPSFLENRLKDSSRLLRMASGAVILVFFTFYVSSGMVAGGVFFESSFNTDYHTGMLVVAAVVVAYTLFGGFLAVSYTDFVQGAIMLLALAGGCKQDQNESASVAAGGARVETKQASNELTPEQLGGTVAFLCSPAASYVTGAVLVERVLAWSALPELIVSDRGVRWGLAAELFAE